MSKMSRDKGANGERELLALLTERLGTTCKRNLDQTRSGGADCIDLYGYSLEVKRHEVLRLPEWWSQTLEQTELGDVPVLAYRQSRKPWRFVVPMWAISGFGASAPSWPLDYTAELSLEGFCYLVRERI